MGSSLVSIFISPSLPTVACEMRCEIPEIARGIANARDAISIVLICRFGERDGALCDRPLIRAIHVLDIDIERRGHGLVFSAGLSHLQDRIADADLRMKDLTLRREIARDLFGSKSPLEEFNQLRRAVRMQVGGDRAQSRRSQACLLVRRDVPMVSRNVLDTRFAISIRLIRRRIEGL